MRILVFKRGPGGIPEAQEAVKAAEQVATAKSEQGAEEQLLINKT